MTSVMENSVVDLHLEKDMGSVDRWRGLEVFCSLWREYCGTSVFLKLVNLSPHALYSSVNYPPLIKTAVFKTTHSWRIMCSSSQFADSSVLVSTSVLIFRHTISYSIALSLSSVWHCYCKANTTSVNTILSFMTAYLLHWQTLIRNVIVNKFEDK